MWTETKFNVTRREASTKRPFGEVVAATEARAPVVQDRLDALVTKNIKAEDLRRQIENHLGASGFALFMKVEHDVIMSHLGRTHRSVQDAIGNPLIAKDVFRRRSQSLPLHAAPTCGLRGQRGRLN